MRNRRTRAQASADTRFRENLELTIHRLPNEIIAQILLAGCPLPDHRCEDIDTEPLSYQVLVTSICRLWRQIALHSPSLWTSVIVRPPPLRYHNLYRKELAAVLARSGTLELDISIKVVCHDDRPPHYYDLLSPHLSRAHTLDVDMEYFAVDLIPVSCIPELGNLRHFYAKGQHNYNPYRVVLPPNLRNAPLETFYYVFSRPLCIFSVPQAELQALTLHLCEGVGQVEGLVKLVNNSRLQKLDLKTWTWDTNAAISSSTLIHLDIQMPQLPVSCLGQLPNLLHLCLNITAVYDRHAMIWPSLPSLRSLHVKSGRRYGPFLKFILQHAQQFVALQITDGDAREVIDLFRERWGKNNYDLDGAARESLRLVRVVVQEMSTEQLENLSELTLILRRQRPHVQTEWYFLAGGGRRFPPVVIDGIDATLVSEEPSPPLFKCADEIIGTSGI